MSWTPEAEDTLRQMWTAGRPTGLIAARLACSRSAVVGKAHRLGLPPHPDSGGNNRGGRPSKILRCELASYQIDPNRADKLLRRFSWQTEDA